MTAEAIDQVRQALGSEMFVEEFLALLERAMAAGLTLTHPHSPLRWRIRMNAAGNLEFLAQETAAALVVVGTLTRGGVWSTAGAQNPAVGSSVPGR